MQHTGTSSNGGMSDQEWGFATYTEKLRIPGRVDSLFFTLSISVTGEVQIVAFSSEKDFWWQDSDSSM